MFFCSEDRMNLHDSPPIRLNAEWISRYATGLLSSTPGLQPLDAVRLAMNASAAAGTERLCQTPKTSAPSGTGQR
jgi:hypothetical protein